MSDIVNVTVFDTSISTLNVGDEIIMRGVNNALFDTFPNGRFGKVASHERIFRAGISMIRHSDYGIVGGSNILSGQMNRYPQWKISLLQSMLIRNKVIMLGVGWREYQQATNLYTRMLLRNLMHPSLLHSVRDSYTELKLREIGFHNVINTACPTMWGLDIGHCQRIPERRSERGIFTLTDYSKDPLRDTALVEIMLRRYRDVYFWIQGRKDMEYFESLNIRDAERVVRIAPNLRAYDEFLASGPCDYIGTRLHAGIRALQNKRRTCIIGIDNRAKEKKLDFNLPVINRDQIADVEQWIETPAPTSINLPVENIKKWKSQFGSENC